MVGVTPNFSPKPRTLAEKVWDDHVVRAAEGEPDLLYIDLHLLHEVTSPQAFDGLRLAGRPVRRVDLTLATEDHNTPTGYDDPAFNTRTGELGPGVSAKDLILALIPQTGTGGGNGHIVEYRGEAIRKLSMEGRMTICNMSIEWGAKAGMIAPDETTFAYLQGREHAPKGAEWDAAVEYWKSLPSDEGAEYDAEIHIDASTVSPFVTWGTNPGQGAPLDSAVPDPEEFVD